MTQWTGSILLSEGQLACVEAVVTSGQAPTVTFNVSVPEIEFSIYWDSVTFTPIITAGVDFVVGYTFTVGNSGEYHYTLKYAAEYGGLSDSTITVTPDCESIEASVSLIGG